MLDQSPSAFADDLSDNQTIGLSHISFAQKLRSSSRDQKAVRYSLLAIRYQTGID